MHTIGEVVTLLDGMGIENTDLQWAPRKAPPLPYAVLVPHKTRNRYADGIVWAKRVSYDLELYCRERNVPLEQRLEAALDGAGIGWSRDHFTDPDGPTVCAVYTMTLTEQEATNGS